MTPGGTGTRRRRGALWTAQCAPAALLCTLISCAPGLSTSGAAIRQSPPERVTNCQFLAIVHGSSSAMELTSADRDIPRNKVLNKAAEMHATDLVWMGWSDANGWGGDAMGRAYRCPPSSTTTMSVPTQRKDIVGR